MSKKIKSAKEVSEYIKAFRCPHCKGTMNVVDFKSLRCENNHSFDFAKQGYINLLTHSTSSHYSRELFEARQNIIKKSQLYSPMHEAITNVIKEHFHVPFMVADLGCGEGSHLQSILDSCGEANITGVGLDIAKEGIILAAKNYDDPIWIVGDLANSPLMDQSYHLILNILSPSNYQEFKRIMAQGGLVIKVVPRSNYLKELREALYNKDEKKIYKNNEIVALFQKHFQLLDLIQVKYSKVLKKDELTSLVQMTPLAWSADQIKIDQFVNRDSTEITIDLDILVGKM